MIHRLQRAVNVSAVRPQYAGCKGRWPGVPGGIGRHCGVAVVRETGTQPGNVSEDGDV